MKILQALTLSALIALPATAMAQDRDLALEEANRTVVVDFYNTVFNDHDVAKGAAVLVDSYKQHNPTVPDGKAPFVDHFTQYFKDNADAQSKIVQSSATDDLVWLHVHSTKNDEDRGRAIVDIFRVKDGKITEHWDVIQPVPETAANDNTMF